MRYLLKITVTPKVWNAYWYGAGKIVSQTCVPGPTSMVTYVVDYGEDRMRAQYQCDRFASGLYFGQVEEVAS